MSSEAMKMFAKSFTQQESIPEEGIARAVEIMRSGRLHRYNVGPGEESEVSLLEREYADWQAVSIALPVLLVVMRFLWPCVWLG